MNSKSDALPLWLDIKKEYIDENFENVLVYLKDSQGSGTDSFYTATLDLIRSRIDDLLEQLTSRNLYDDILEEDNGEKIRSNTFTVRLIGACLLIDEKMKTSYRVNCELAFLNYLCHLVPKKFIQFLLNKSVPKSLSGEGLNKFYSWEDLIDFQPQILAHKIITGTDAEAPREIVFRYEQKGTIAVENHCLLISPTSKKEFDTLIKSRALSESIQILDGHIKILNTRENRLKKGEAKNISRLKEFTREHIALQKKVSRQSPKYYREEDDFKVRITKIGYDIEIESIDPEFERWSGRLKNECLLYYEFHDFKEFLRKDDIIAVRLEDAAGAVASISEDFISYILERISAGESVLAKILEISTNKKGYRVITWFSEKGYPAYSNYNEDDGLSVGDSAMISVRKINPNGYIHARFENRTDRTFEISAAKEACISEFPYDSFKENEEQFFGKGAVKQLYNILIAYQNTLTQPTERYRILCVARILAELTEHTEDSSYIEFLSSYLENLIHFAKGEYEKVHEVKTDGSIPGYPDIEKKKALIKIMTYYGNSNEEDYLSWGIHQSGDPILIKTATLVLSYNRIGNIIGKSIKSAITHEIIHTLALESGDVVTDLEEENAIYLGTESGLQEFKTSIFFAPDNSKEPQIANICREFCAFMNSKDGGVLYIGVDDMGYVKGIGADIEYMEKKIIGNYYGIDGYIRYIMDRAKEYFPVAVLSEIVLKPILNDSVIAVNVHPYPYGIVQFREEAYIRINSECVLMDDMMKKLKMERCTKTDKKISSVVQLENCIRHKVQARFHAYRSSNSGEVVDRYVEPFKLDKDGKFVWCYDLEQDENKVFKTERIGSVEMLEKKWEKSGLHRSQQMDLFGMSGGPAMHIVLRLDMMAKNLLLEEFPESVRYISAGGKGGEWILDTEVYHIGGVLRFYMGLAGHIEILSGEPLKEEVRKYIEAIAERI